MEVKKLFELPFQIDHFTEELIGRRDRLRVGLETPLVLNEVYEFHRKVDRRSLERLGKDLSAPSTAWSAECGSS